MGAHEDTRRQGLARTQLVWSSPDSSEVALNLENERWETFPDVFLVDSRAIVGETEGLSGRLPNTCPGMNLSLDLGTLLVVRIKKKNSHPPWPVWLSG